MDPMRAAWHRAWEEDRQITPRVVCFSWYRALRRGQSARIQHPYWVLDYTVKGDVRTRVGSARSPWTDRKARVAHLYPPRICYWECTDDAAAPVEGGYIVFHMDPAACAMGPLKGDGPYARIADPDGVIERLLRDGARAAADPPAAVSFWLAQSSLCALLAAINRAVPDGHDDWRLEAALPRQGVSDALVLEVDEYLRTHLGEPVALDKLARVARVSASSLSHRYKALTGRSPMQALRVLRIERAKTLLLQGYKQEDIAVQCGFYDAAHFSRTFSRLAGQNPKRFARA